MSGRINFYSACDGNGVAHGKTVVIAVDGSDAAEKAFDWYMNMLHRRENRIVLVHVPEARNLELETDVKLTVEDVQDIVQHCNKTIASMVLKFQTKLDGNEIDCVFRTVYGKPGEVIVDVALNEDASLVVMGTRGMGQIRRTILGSVSDYVVQHAHSPVIVCRH
jgi:nucleotide-binding universal stress UspA family protein